VFVPRTSSTPTATWFWQTEGRSAERVISGVRPSEVHLVGVSIFFEKNFYQLPFTPPLSFVVSVLQPRDAKSAQGDDLSE
jgi:hypothetical protein